MNSMSAMLKSFSPRSAAALVALLCAAVLLPPVPGAQAWTYIGCRWNSGGITYRNDMTGGAVTPSNNALTNWTNQTVITFIQQSSNPDFNMLNGNYGNTIWDGEMNGTCNSTGRFNKGAFVRINSYYTASYSDPKKRSVIAHELGHIVGLGEYNAGACATRALMYGATPGRWDQCSINTVQADDIAGAAAIY